MLIPMALDDPLPMAWLETNDLGNAHRLVRLAKGLLKWVEEIGWVAYDGKRWSARDGNRRANELAHEVSAHIAREADALFEICGDADKLEAALGFKVDVDHAGNRADALFKHAVKSGDASRTQAMLAQARTLLTTRREEFDRDPLAFNLQNGTLRFVQDSAGGWVSRLDAHEPTDMLMQIASVSYDATADCPRWKERMKLIQPAKDQRAFLQQRYGYFLTGLTSEQKWFIDQGRGGDGKSLTNAVIARLFGDYYRHADVASFLKGMQKSGADHTADLERLAGDVRFVLADEPERTSTWNGTRLKQITGGEVTARGVGAKVLVDYIPRWKLLVEVNPLPAVPSDDDGFWRRCLPTPWHFQFDKDGVASEPFERLRDSLLAEEGNGILNWMVAGALKWLVTQRLTIPAATAEFLANYRQSASPFSEWLAECCDTSDRSAMTEASALYKHFKEYCERGGVDKIPTQTAFGRSLRDRHCLVHKDPVGIRWRKGIRIKPDFTITVLGSAAAHDQGGGGGRGSASPIGPQADVDFDGNEVDDDV